MIEAREIDGELWIKASDHHRAIAELESQEPVALPCCGYTDANAVKWNPFNGIVQCHNCGHTYAPSQRTWVGLTDEDAEEVWQSVQASDFHDCVKPFAQGIEAKLKEKNNA
jgi:hypothetical protein